MRRTLLTSVAVLLLSVALELSAQCKQCYFDPQTDCASCVMTNYNAMVLCDVTHNGYGCTMTGQCTGTEGDCRVQHRVELRQPKQEREWQLVSVEITHIKESKRRS